MYYETTILRWKRISVHTTILIRERIEKLQTGNMRATIAGDIDWDPIYELKCKKQACAIQWCLSRKNYQEKKCQAELDAYKNCCAKAKEDLLRKQPQSSSWTPHNAQPTIYCIDAHCIYVCKLWLILPMHTTWKIMMIDRIAIGGGLGVVTCPRLGRGWFLILRNDRSRFGVTVDSTSNQVHEPHEIGIYKNDASIEWYIVQIR